MATNFYHEESYIHFGPEPSVHAGYYVSTTGDAESITPFSSVAIREEFETALEPLIPANAEYDLLSFAAAVAGHCGAGDSDGVAAHVGDRVIKEVLGDIYENEEVSEQLDAIFTTHRDKHR